MRDQNIMNTYYELKEVANRKGINTFGDIAKAFDVDCRDIWGDSDEVEEMSGEFLFNCDAALSGLQNLKEEGIL
jgi:hypothetical protein